MEFNQVIAFASVDARFMEYDDSAVFDYTPQQVFDVISDIERYPEFLPGWQRVKIMRRDGNTLQVEQQVGMAFISWRFESRATFDPPDDITIHSINGPFANLETRWSLAPAGDNKTRVSLRMHSDKVPGPAYRFLQSLMNHTQGSLLDRFKARVKAVYSSGSHY
ncbi:MAG: type II toxin-antitoxin system RatA family toxin [Gammaproteobacteria bacterium]|jgi:coenzyme Q-binding protein COQ10